MDVRVRDDILIVEASRARRLDVIHAHLNGTSGGEESSGSAEDGDGGKGKELHGEDVWSSGLRRKLKVSPKRVCPKSADVSHYV